MNIRKVLLGFAAVVLASTISSAQIQRGKAITMTISNVPEPEKAQFNNTYPVSDSGTINVPYLGTVQAAGMQPEGLASVLQSRFKSAQIYNNPTIQVIMTTVAGTINTEVVTVGGDVRRPGSVPYTKELTLWGAIQAAGGETEFGSIRRVKVTRDGSQKSYDVSKPQFKQIPLQRYDAIEIPRKGAWEGLIN